jgi:nucleotide-binding universal stress UspA family protein
VKPVLVGYDGSEEADKAVRWAARYAQRRSLTLTVVHCWVWPLFTRDLGPVSGVEGSGLRNAALATLGEGRAVALAAAPGLTVDTRLETGYPAAALTRLSAGAALVVSGSRGLGGFLGLLVGSVSPHLAAGAGCPVAVIRRPEPEGASVVAAVDGSEESLAALVMACDIASRQGSVLQVVHVGQELPAALRHRRGHREADDGAILGRAAELARTTAPELTIKEAHLSSRSIPGTLLNLAEEAYCLVMGAKGADGIGVRLGSTVHAVLHHSAGNVLIWRAGEQPRPPAGSAGAH